MLCLATTAFPLMFPQAGHFCSCFSPAILNGPPEAFFPSWHTNTAPPSIKNSLQLHVLRLNTSAPERSENQTCPPFCPLSSQNLLGQALIPGSLKSCAWPRMLCSRDDSFPGVERSNHHKQTTPVCHGVSITLCLWVISDHRERSRGSNEISWKWHVENTN